MMTTTIAALLIGGLSYAEVPESVTFSHPCAHSSVVLAALGEELGVRMEPSGSVNKDYFLVRFDDVPVDEALDKIAETLNATWTEKSGVRYLGRTHAQELAEEKEDLAGMVRGIQKYLAEHTVQGKYTLEFASNLITQSIDLQANPDDPVVNSRIQKIRENSPANRFLHRVLASFDPESLARIEEGWAVRYSPNPISGLRALPSGGIRAYDQFLQETAIHRQAIEATNAFARVSSERKYSDLVNPYETRIGSHDGVVVEIRREQDNLRVRAFLPGTIYYSRLGSAWIQPDEIALPLDPALAGLTAKQGISPLMKQVIEFVLTWGGRAPDGMQVEAPPEMREVLSSPTTNDPLAVLGSDWIFQTARELDVNVVALLPDLGAFIPFFAYGQGAESLGAVWSMTAMEDVGITPSVSGDWLIVTPTYRLKTRKERLDRPAIERFIEGYEKTGSKSLDTVADLVRPTETMMSLMFSLMLAAFGLGEPSIVTGINDFGDLDALRLYSHLSPSARKAAKSGGHRIPVNSLTGDVSKYATRLLFGKQTNIEELREEISAAAGFLAGERHGIGIDAQHGLADGIPPGSAIIVYVVSHQAVFPKQTTDGAAYMGGGLTAHSLADRIAGAEYGGWNAPNPSLLAVVEVEQVVIEFVFPGVGYAYAQAKVDHLGRDTKYMSIDDMDPEWRKEYEEKLKVSRKMYEQVMKEQGGRRNPPPSR